MVNPFDRIWHMIFRTPNAKVKAVSAEIEYLEQLDKQREQKLSSMSQTLTLRAKELDRMVEEMKEARRGFNG